MFTHQFNTDIQNIFLLHDCHTPRLHIYQCINISLQATPRAILHPQQINQFNKRNSVIVESITWVFCNVLIIVSFLLMQALHN